MSSLPDRPGDFFSRILLLIAVILIGAAIAYLVTQFVRKEKEVQAEVNNIGTIKKSLSEKISELPIHVEESVDGFYEEAKRQYAAGNYAKAIIYYYGHLLISLDESQIIRLTKGKTNRQYLKEIVRNRSRDFSNLVESTVVLFEESFFGKHDIQKIQFEECWNKHDEFQRQLQRTSS